MAWAQGCADPSQHAPNAHHRQSWLGDASCRWEKGRGVARRREPAAECIQPGVEPLVPQAVEFLDESPRGDSRLLGGEARHEAIAHFGDRANLVADDLRVAGREASQPPVQTVQLDRNPAVPIHKNLVGVDDSMDETAAMGVFDRAEYLAQGTFRLIDGHSTALGPQEGIQSDKPFLIARVGGQHPRDMGVGKGKLLYRKDVRVFEPRDLLERGREPPLLGPVPARELVCDMTREVAIMDRKPTGRETAGLQGAKDAVRPDWRPLDMFRSVLTQPFTPQESVGPWDTNRTKSRCSGWRTPGPDHPWEAKLNHSGLAIGRHLGYRPTNDSTRGIPKNA